MALRGLEGCVTVLQRHRPQHSRSKVTRKLNMADVVDLSEQKFLRALNAAMKFFVVEYTLREDSTSIRTLENVLRDNYKRIRNGVPKDYLPVGLFKSRADAERYSLYFQSDVAPQAQLEAGSRKWKQIGDCFENELDRLLRCAEPYEESIADSEK
jgi:hypothetical protein